MSDGSAKPPPSSVAAFHFLAGLTSGIFTAVLLQPADLLKTRIQQASSEHVARIPGQPGPLISNLRAIYNSPRPIQNLWRGTVPSAIRTGCGSALYFGGLNSLRSNIARREKLLSACNPDGTIQANSSSALPKLSATANLSTGAVARAGAGFAMMPITVIKVRYESSLYSYRSLWGAVRDIATKEGLKGFFAGFGATAVRDAPYAGLYVLFYEGSKKYLGSLVHITPAKTTADAQETLRMKASTSAGINFVSGTTAAVLATSVTNPFDAIKTRLQLLPDKYGNMVKAAKMMLRHEGVRSMFDGLALRMGRKAISSALAWTIYEELIRKAEVRWKEGALM